MSILLLLNILPRSKYICIYHVFDPTTLCTQQTNCKSTACRSKAECIDDVWRISTSANANSYITWLDHVRQLFCKDVFIGGIIAPGSNQWHMVGQRYSLQTWRSRRNGILSQVKGEM